ncbi:SAM-dependent methyltransferase [Nocardiopsis alkaliphila]|nr:SAM-dependent methyltransferase [Nocardiopsis alkaliphila]
MAEERAQSTVEQWNASGPATYHPRSPEQVTGFFDGWDLLEPGVVSCSL